MNRQPVMPWCVAVGKKAADAWFSGDPGKVSFEVVFMMLSPFAGGPHGMLLPFLFW